MTIQEHIASDYVAAYKAKDTVRLSVLRLLKTAAVNRSSELRRPLVDSDMLDLIAKAMKQRKESAEQYAKYGRSELAATEEAEMVVLQGYLPAPLNDAELAQIIDRLVVETGASGPKEMGKIMQALNEGYKGRFDGKRASAAVRAKLVSK